MRAIWKFLFYGGTSVLCVVALLLFLNKTHIEGILKEQLIYEIQKNRVRASIGNLSLHTWGIELKSVELFVPQSFTTFSIDSATLTPLPQKILSGIGAAHVALRGYGGVMDAEITKPLFKKEMGVDLVIAHLALGQLAPMQAFGINQGQLDAQLKSCVVRDGIAQYCSIVFGITNLEKPQQTRLSAQLTKLPLDIVIPPLTSAEINADFLISAPDIAELKSAYFNSNLGTFTANLSLAQFSNHAIISSGNLRAKLTDEGAPFFSPVFSLLAPGIPYGSRDVRLGISGFGSRPQFRNLALVD